MSTKTTNYEFIKPALSDVANIEDMNPNWDKLDSFLFALFGAVIEGLVANRVLVADENGKVSVSDITATELGYLDGVKSNIQNQIDNIEVDINGAASTIKDDNLTANRILISDGSGKVAVSNITTTILNYLSGVTSNVQTQLNNKVSKNGDIVNGMLTFQNTDAYHALMKYRAINGTTYGVNVGCGILGGQGIVSLEVRQGTDTTSPILGRLEIGDLGVSYVDSEGARTYLQRSGLASATVE